MPTKNKSSLPAGVTPVKNRNGLYRLRVMVYGKSYSEYHTTHETTKKALQSELQKAVDAFRERVENGTLISGNITDKSTFAQTVEWFKELRKTDIKQSTQLKDNFNLERYLLPALGGFKLNQITSPMITKLLANLVTHGGTNGRSMYIIHPDFLEHIEQNKPTRQQGGYNKIARDINIGVDNTFIRIRKGERCEKETAQKVARYFGYTITQAFDMVDVSAPLSPSFVSAITYTLSAVFSACVKNGILASNPVNNASKPRIGERDTPAYLDNKQIQVFMSVLDTIDCDNSVRVALHLMLQLGLRTGEARGLRWIDVDIDNRVVHIEKNAGDTFNGLELTDLKTKRSRRKIQMSALLCDILNDQKERQTRYRESLGSLWVDMGVVCPGIKGNLMNRTIPNNLIKRIIKQAPSLPQGLHAHSLRHSFISALIAIGTDIVTVAEIAGDTIEIINKHYAHVFNERKASAMDMMSNLFSRTDNNLISVN